MFLADIIQPQQIELWIQSGGYLMLFLLLWGCGLGLPVPEDVPLVISGVLISQGHMSWCIAPFVAWTGIIGGDICLYHIGRSYGLNIAKLPLIGRHFTAERIEHVEVWFKKHGIWTVAVCRMIAGVRGAMVVAAGITRFNRVKFIIADGMAAVVSGGIFMVLGWWAGSNFDKYLRIAKHFEFELGTTLGVIGVVLVAIYIWRRRTPGDLRDVIVEKVVDRTPMTPEARQDVKRDQKVVLWTLAAMAAVTAAIAIAWFVYK
jgi:membrane protein DedA with SNARE-associated domain